MIISDYSKISFKPTYAEYKKNTEDKRAEEERLKAEEAEKKREEMKKKAEEELKQQEAELKNLEMQLESAKEQAEATEEMFSSLAKCLVIATRITRGDNVPLKDMDYLRENQPDLYKQSIMLRQPNDDPEDCESVLEEEDTEGDSVSENTGGTSPTPPTSPTPDTGSSAPAESAPVTEISI